MSLLMNHTQARHQDLARQKTEQPAATSESINNTINNRMNRLEAYMQGMIQATLHKSILNKQQQQFIQQRKCQKEAVFEGDEEQVTAINASAIDREKTPYKVKNPERCLR